MNVWFYLVPLLFVLSTKAEIPKPTTMTPTPIAPIAAQAQQSPAPASAQVTMSGPATQPTVAAPQQPSREVVLGKSYQEVQERYKKIREQKQKELVEKTKAQAKPSTAQPTKKASTHGQAQPAQQQMSIQDYYWQQQVERQKLKAGVQTPQSVSDLERQTYVGMPTQTKAPTKKPEEPTVKKQPTQRIPKRPIQRKKTIRKASRTQARK